MPIGGGNPLGFQIGGGPTPTEEAYSALKSMVGVGNSADDPDTTIIEAWRFAKARGLSAAVKDEIVALQHASPLNATDLIPMYERLLQTYFAADVPDQTRREVLAEAWVETVDSVHDTVVAAIEAIDPTAEFPLPPRDEIREGQPGRYFEDYDPTSLAAAGPAFGITNGKSGPKCTSFPNFSDDFRFHIRVPRPAGVLSLADQRIISDIGAKLRTVMPAWCADVIFTNPGGSGGFILDLDLLDVTAF